MVGVNRERTRKGTTNNGTTKSLRVMLWGVALIVQLSKHGGILGVDAFVPFVDLKPTAATTTTTSRTTSTALEAAPPRRLPDNAEGPLYVNDKCINCSACSMFAPTVFSRGIATDTHHIVSKQPNSELEIEESRAALAACPVAAIRVEPKKLEIATAAEETETEIELVLADQLAINPKFNGRELPFPRPVSPNLPDVHFIGYHNSRSFGAAPYLLKVPSSSSSVSDAKDTTWVLVDTPLYSKRAVEAVESLTGTKGPSYLVLTHVDDTADHNRWKEHYPKLKRIFHAGDLGVHNWIGDQTLEDVEILLHSTSSGTQLQYFDLKGTPIDSNNDNDDDDTSQDPLVLVHTPGHSPGSISLLKKPTADCPGVLFSGDTYSYTTRDGGHLSGFPRYGNDARLQSKILPQLLDLDWMVLAPGHGHVRDYTLLQSETESENEGDASEEDVRRVEMKDALDELTRYF